MIPDPLHPALVHFPVVLAILLPVAALTALFAIRRGARTRPTWAVVVAMSAGLFAASFVTARTGQAQEDAVEGVLVSEAPLHDHEEAAERFLIIAGVVFGLSAIGLLGGRSGRVGRASLAVGSLAAALAIYPVGKSGGELVYDHGAAQAYASDATRLRVSADGRSDGDRQEHRGRQDESRD